VRYFDLTTCATVLCFGVLGPWSACGQSLSSHEKPPHCGQFHIDDKASTPLSPGPPAKTACKTREAANGLLLPDPKCTPGAINPTLTAKVLQDPAFTTKCVRNDATSEEEKHSTYTAYGIPRPVNNEGENQTCELDHLVSLELGGADTLDNIWPQCGPNGVELRERYFKLKDMVEDHLAEFVRHGRVDLGEMQKRIAEDWTQFLEAAKETCSRRKCKEHDQP
jgi:hypothetical protein